MTGTTLGCMTQINEAANAVQAKVDKATGKTAKLEEEKKKRAKEQATRTIFPSWSSWTDWSPCITPNDYWYEQQSTRM